MDNLDFKIDVPGLLHELPDAISNDGSILKVPLNIFTRYLTKVTARAIELNDPELNIIMLSMKLYDVPHSEILEQIEIQQKLIDNENS